MAGIRSLAKDTAIYGVSSIVGRFLNWLLVPLYTYVFAEAEYGIVTYLYSFTAVALVVLNYGMETGFFRFANRENDPERVYTTSLISVGTTSLLFILLLSLFLQPVSDAILLPGHPLYVWLLGVTVAVDAFTNIPFAYLRFRKRPVRFAAIKMANVGLNILLNLFFILLCPWLARVCPSSIAWFYDAAGGEAFGIGWIFTANIISTLCILLMLLPELTGRRWRFSGALLRGMLAYSWPLLVLGVAGILSQTLGQLIIPYLFESQPEAARAMVGVYGANVKIAVVMVMFTQAFRYAYEPFIFSQAGKEGESRKQAYCDAMKYFVIFSLLIFMAVMFLLPVLRRFIGSAYWSGLDVVPVMMAADICFGVYFNLSLWYKLTDRTQWGMYFSLFCFLLMLGLNLWLVPAIGIPRGYMGSAWAALIAYAAVMVLSWAVGRRYYPLPYQLGRMALYVIFAALCCVGGLSVSAETSPALAWPLRAALLLLYVAVVCRFENVPVLTPALRRLTSRRRE